MRKYYSGITLFKLVGSLLVLMGHVRIPDLYAEYSRIPGLQQAVSFIVPCFYLISGFLAYKGWAGAVQPGVYIRRYLGGLAAVYVGLCVLALAIGNGNHVFYETSAWHNMILPMFKLYLVIGPYPSLWFVPPLLVSVAFCYHCQQRGWLRWAVGLAAAGFVAAQLVFGSLRVVLEAAGSHVPWQGWLYAELLQTTMFNYFGMALPFVLAGVLVARREAAFVALPARQLAAWALSSLALEIGLLRWLAPADYTYPLIVSALPIGLWVFYGLLHLRFDGIRRYHTVVGRFSAVLYFLHYPLVLANMRLLRLPASANWQLHIAIGPALLLMLLTVLETVLLTWLLGWGLPRPASRPPAMAVPDMAQANTY